MNEFISGVKTSICNECLSSRCKKQGCVVLMTNAPRDRIIIDLDCEKLRVQSGEKQCDYLLVIEENLRRWVVAIDMKRGGFSARTVVEQLSAGAVQAKALCPSNESFELVPLLVPGDGMNPRDLRILNSEKVGTRGQKRQIVRIRYGQSLLDALRKCSLAKACPLGRLPRAFLGSCARIQVTSKVPRTETSHLGGILLPALGALRLRDLGGVARSCPAPGRPRQSEPAPANPLWKTGRVATSPTFGRIGTSAKQLRGF